MKKLFLLTVIMSFVLFLVTAVTTFFTEWTGVDTVSVWANVYGSKPVAVYALYDRLLGIRIVSALLDRASAIVGISAGIVLFCTVGSELSVSRLKQIVIPMHLRRATAMSLATGCMSILGGAVFAAISSLHCMVEYGESSWMAFAAHYEVSELTVAAFASGTLICSFMIVRKLMISLIARKHYHQI